MRIKILDKFWDLEFGRVPGKDNGSCEAPDVKGKKIVIRPSLRGEKLIDTVLHETHHASDWWKDEEWVEEVASQQAHILTRQEVIERVFDDGRLLERVAHVLAKHGYVKE